MTDILAILAEIRIRDSGTTNYPGKPARHDTLLAADVERLQAENAALLAQIGALMRAARDGTLTITDGNQKIGIGVVWRSMMGPVA